MANVCNCPSPILDGKLLSLQVFLNSLEEKWRRRRKKEISPSIAACSAFPGALVHSCAFALTSNSRRRRREGSFASLSISRHQEELSSPRLHRDLGRLRRSNSLGRAFVRRSCGCEGMLWRGPNERRRERGEGRREDSLASARETRQRKAPPASESRRERAYLKSSGM